MSRLVSFIVLIAIILVIGFFFFRVMSPFLLPLFLAVLLVVIFHPLHLRVLQRCHGRHRLASTITTGLIILIVLLPLLSVIFMAAAEGSALIARLNPAELRDKVARARDKFPLLKMPHADLIRAIESNIEMLVTDSTEPKLEPGDPGDVSAIIADLDRLRAEEKVTTFDSGPKFDAVHESLAKALETAGGDVPSIAYRDALRAAASQFHELKLEQLGGAFRTWLKELANPTEAVLQQNFRRFLADTRVWLFSIGGRTTALAGKVVIGLIITIVAAFFFLAEGPKMVATLMRLSPLDDRYEHELLADFTNVSRAVVVATLLSALVQGLLGGIGYSLAGFHSVMLMTMLTGLLAMIPFVGRRRRVVSRRPLAVFHRRTHRSRHPAGDVRLRDRLEHRQSHQTARAPRAIATAPTASTPERAGRSQRLGPDWHSRGAHVGRLPADAAQYSAPRTAAFRPGTAGKWRSRG